MTRGARSPVRDVWGLADYGPLAERLAPASRLAVDALAPVAGLDALDVAAGDGTAARMLADAGARVVAVDASPAMVGRGRDATAGTDVDWRLGDALALPVAAAAVDRVVSSFGVMFAEPRGALAEIGRVLRPGGRVALTVWAGSGFMADMGRLIAEATGGPAGDLDAWRRVDDPDGLGGWCAGADLVDVAVAPAALPWRFPSAAAMTRFFVDHSPAHVAAADAAGTRAPALFSAIERLAAPDGGAVDLAADHVLITATRRPS